MNTQAAIETQEAPWTSLVTDNVRLAYKIAYQYNQICSLDLDELKELALLGLVKAARVYDDSKGVQFSSFASRCCINEIRYYLRGFLGHTKEDISMYTPQGAEEDDERLLLDTIKDDHDFTESLAMTDAIQHALLTLDDREQEVIRLRYFTESPMGQQDVADRLHVSQGCISKIEKKALTKMRELLQD